MSEELIPCPFCGGEAAGIENYCMHVICWSCPPTSGNPHSAIQCKRCGGVMMGTAEAWNRRAK